MPAAPQGPLQRSARFGRVGLRHLGQREAGTRGRQFNLKACAAQVGVGDADGTALKLRELLDDGQPKTGAGDFAICTAATLSEALKITFRRFGRTPGPESSTLMRVRLPTS